MTTTEPPVADESGRLVWVVTPDGTHPVSDFAGLPVADRPECLCPLCHTKVVLKLGEERAHHAAHEPGAVCALTRTIPLLRMNTVLHAWWEFRRAKVLLLRLHCGCSRACGLIHAHPVARDWDEVRVRAKPDEDPEPWDVLLLRNGAPLFALRVSTRDLANSARASLDALQIPWVILFARAGFYAGPTSWTASVPLDPDVAWSGLPRYLSTECAQREALRPARQSALRAIVNGRPDNPSGAPPSGLDGGPRPAAPRVDPQTLQIRILLCASAEVQPRGKEPRTDVFRLSQVFRGQALVRTELTRHRGTMLSETIASVPAPCADTEPRLRAALEDAFRDEAARGTRITLGEWNEPDEAQ